MTTPKKSTTTIPPEVIAEINQLTKKLYEGKLTIEFTYVKEAKKLQLSIQKNGQKEIITQAVSVKRTNRFFNSFVNIVKPEKKEKRIKEFLSVYLKNLQVPKENLTSSKESPESTNQPPTPEEQMVRLFNEFLEEFNPNKSPLTRFQLTDSKELMLYTESKKGKEISLKLKKLKMSQVVKEFKTLTSKEQQKKAFLQYMQNNEALKKQHGFMRKIFPVSKELIEEATKQLYEAHQKQVREELKPINELINTWGNYKPVLLDLWDDRIAPGINSSSLKKITVPFEVKEVENNQGLTLSSTFHNVVLSGFSEVDQLKLKKRKADPFENIRITLQEYYPLLMLYQFLCQVIDDFNQTLIEKLRSLPYPNALTLKDFEDVLPMLDDVLFELSARELTLMSQVRKKRCSFKQSYELYRFLKEEYEYVETLIPQRLNECITRYESFQVEEETYLLLDSIQCLATGMQPLFELVRNDNLKMPQSDQNEDQWLITQKLQTLGGWLVKKGYICLGQVRPELMPKGLYALKGTPFQLALNRRIETFQELVDLLEKEPNQPYLLEHLKRLKPLSMADIPLLTEFVQQAYYLYLPFKQEFVSVMASLISSDCLPLLELNLQFMNGQSRDILFQIYDQIKETGGVN